MSTGYVDRGPKEANAMTSPETRAVTPPYLPYKTFTAFLDELKETAVPQQIDPSVMPRFSGTMRTQMRTALRFLGLIEDDGKVNAKMRALVEARGTERWKEMFSATFFDAYGEILANLDMKGGTLHQLKERFRATGVEGSVLIKAVRFFLSAIEETGTKFSPHFLVRGLSKGVASKPRQKSSAKSRRNEEPEEEGDEEGVAEEKVVTPANFQRFSLPMKGETSEALMILPQEMTKSQWDMLNNYIRMYYGFAE
ncbi:MAG: DUF5343 domain-containing protein [Gemmatimonadaceae bacterium]|nr:DUF5343 domain-containing protein [Gemmatimonadaceae bacterium]